MNPNVGKTAVELFGVRVAKGTRERILFAAIELFYTYGFHEVGLDRILESVGVTKTTFYKHFRSRDDLIVEALSTRDEWEAAAMSRGMRERAGYDPRGLLIATFDVMDEWFNHPDYNGCLFVLACAEFPTPTSPIHKRAAKSFEVAETQIRQMAEAAGVHDPVAFARAYVMLVEGALTRRLVSGDNGAARAAREIVALLLETELGPVRPARSRKEPTGGEPPRPPPASEKATGATPARRRRGG